MLFKNQLLSVIFTQKGHNSFTSWNHRSWILCVLELLSTHNLASKMLGSKNHSGTLADYIRVIINNELYGRDSELCTFMDVLLHEDKHSHGYAPLAPCNFFISSQLRWSSCLIREGVKKSTKRFFSCVFFLLWWHFMYYSSTESSSVHFPKHGPVTPESSKRFTTQHRIDGYALWSKLGFSIMSSDMSTHCL